MQTIRIGGVPEHFNLPWHLAIENNLFKNEHIDVKWIDYKGGTGAMTTAMQNNEIDVSIVLTEGIVAAIANGSKTKIIGKYLNTPLIWGIFSGINNPLNYYGEIYTKKYAISRFGSGSHLMAYIDAHTKKIKLKNNQFTVIKNLEGALESLTKQDTDVFYWEQYTTKPYVDSKQLKQLGNYITPWPCFVITANESFIKTNRHDLQKMLDVIYFTSKQFMHSINAIDEVSKRYSQLSNDVEQWFYSTEWSTNNYLSEKILDNVVFTLLQAGIITKKIAKNELMAVL